ncbi:DUF7553 family protein [Halostella litorea]|uniref:DUF7553 family protein n=1 Tax=Halostella litorea TaxID=2528831 RepID=UPI001092FFC0|nr:hypothetical protein [Halostella litorea]
MRSRRTGSDDIAAGDPRPALSAANEALLRAIETPPDTGREDRIDDLAAELWFLAREKDRRPDQGRLERVQYSLTLLLAEVREPRARHVARARRYLQAFRARVDGV